MLVGEDGVGPAHRPEPCEHLTLAVQAFGHGLDDQIGLGEVGQVSGQADALQGGVACGGVQAALGHRTAHGVLDAGAARLQVSLVQDPDNDRVAGTGAGLGDAGAHGAASHDADRANVRSLGFRDGEPPSGPGPEPIYPFPAGVGKCIAAARR